MRSGLKIKRARKLKNVENRNGKKVKTIKKNFFGSAINNLKLSALGSIRNEYGPVDVITLLTELIDPKFGRITKNTNINSEAEIVDSNIPSHLVAGSKQRARPSANASGIQGSLEVKIKKKQTAADLIFPASKKANPHNRQGKTM